MKTKLIFSLSMMLFAFGNLPAQMFKKAPAPKVKSIIEWTKDLQDDDQGILKGSIHEFQKDGKLTYWMENSYELETKYAYNSIGQLKQMTEWYRDYEANYKYGYKRNYYVEEYAYKGTSYKTFNYVNDKKQIVETKEFVKEEEDDSYLVDRRIIYNYYKSDSIRGKTHYNYYYKNGKKSVEKSWTLYYYNNENGKVKLMQRLNSKGDLSYFTEYEYNDKGRLKLTRGRGGDGEYETTTDYLYKDGKIWQKIHHSRTEGKTVSVYKNGLLIRERVYERKNYDSFLTTDPDAYKLIRISNFQYTYYD